MICDVFGFCGLQINKIYRIFRIEGFGVQQGTHTLASKLSTEYFGQLYFEAFKGL
jgi:hypothetical protein